MKYHQNIALEGKDLPAEFVNRKGSNFFNEGKWNNFIAPLLPADATDMTFVEIGCNVGLYLKTATEYGFRNVVGVERDIENVEMASNYRDAHGMDYKVLHREVGKDFDWDEIPVADVVLLSNVHYYIHMSDFMPFLDKMLYKTRYCIVVSRQMREKKHGHPRPEESYIRDMFKRWNLVRVRHTSSQMIDGDPHPRQLHSMLFQSIELQRQSIEDYTTRTQRYVKQQEFIDIALKGPPYDFDMRETENFKYWQNRKQKEKKTEKGRWSDDDILKHCWYRFHFVESMVSEGMIEPVLVYPHRECIDGGNRAQVLKLLGYKSIIVRIV